MKRIVSICIIICTFAAFGVIFHNERRQGPQETQQTGPVAVCDTEPVADVAVQQTAVSLYLAKDIGGRIVIYRTDTMEVYLETGIKTASLPEELKGRLTEGIGFADEPELFDFLESYSS